MLGFNRAGLYIERYWPRALGASAAAVWYRADIHFPKDPSGLMGASATLAAVFAGFLGVAQSLILTMKGSLVYDAMKLANLLPPLFRYLKAGIYASAIFAIVSVAGFFILPDEMAYSPLAKLTYECIWAAVGVYAFASYSRITGIMFKLLHQV